MIHPLDIITLRAQTGVGNMGNVTNESSICRFSLPSVKAYCLVSVRGLFTGGTSQAAMTMFKDHRLGSNYNFKTWTWPTAGTDATDRIELRIPEDEIYHYLYETDAPTGIQDSIVFEWANPNTQRWALEIGLIDAGRVQGGSGFLNA